MFVSLRAAVLVLAFIAPASVAPAQVAQPVPASFPILEPAVVTTDSASDVTQVPDEPVVDQAQPEAEKPTKSDTLPMLVARLRASDPGSRERECLATAIYFESKSEPLTGQLAVGEVLANRIHSGRFATSYCGVVTQRGQFSFVRAGRLPAVPRASRQWRDAVAIATIVDQGMMASAAPKALFFHARRVSPGWHATRVATIGNHVFFR